MRHTTICSLLAATALPAAVVAQPNWQVVDDFSSGNADAWTINNLALEGANILIYELPEIGDDHYMWLDTKGHGGVGWGDMHVSRPLPFGINPGESATLYWEHWSEGRSNAYLMNLTDHDKPAAWSDAVSTFRWSWEADPAGPAQVHSGGYAYLKADGYTFDDQYNRLYPQVGEWHKFWMVIHHAVDPLDTKWELWYQGPGGQPVQTEIVSAVIDNSDPDNPVLTGYAPSGVKSYGIRRPPEGPIDMLHMGSNAGNPGGGGYGQNTADPWAVTNIYLTLGSYGGVDPFSSGGESYYGGYLIQEGWIDTANLSWVYVGDGAEFSGWVYSDGSIGAGLGWIYMPQDTMTSQGDWVYIPR